MQADHYSINAQRVVFCANAALLQAFALTKPEQQLRPLHMVMAKGPVYAIVCTLFRWRQQTSITVTTHLPATVNGSGT